MAGYEYKVLPAPDRGTKARGVKTPEERFSLSLEKLMNELGAEGWEYQRAETLPSVERTGLTGSTTNWRHVLVFRRAVHDGTVAAAQPTEEDTKPAELPEEPAPAPEPPAPAPAKQSEPPAPPKSTPTQKAAPDSEDHPAGQPGATTRLRDDGVEEISDVAGVTTSLSTLAASRKSTGKSDV